jgi:cytochrome c peroxidase
MRPARFAIVLSAAASAACAPASDDLPPLPWERSALPAVSDPADNPSTPEKVELGRLLFYDPILSADRKVACATCHSEIWGLGDGLALSVGIDGEGPAGPGREGPNMTTRNAPTLWNVAYRAAFFWDGRAASLEEQALMPIENEVELARDLDELVADLRGIEGYRDLFADAFDGAEPITTENLARALAAFERSFVSARAPYDRYAAGDVGALDAESVRGMYLFADAGCASCHAPPFFAADVFAARGIGSGDDGRFEVTDDPADRAAFRVPTLRNVRETEPYFHDGSADTLAEAVAVEAGALVDEAGALAIARFLDKGLMDRTLEPSRPKEVPSGLEVPIDGLRVPR